METAEVMTRTKWTLDESHCEIGFQIKHLMISNVRGHFKEFGATVYTQTEDPATADIDFWLNTASINTGDLKRDEHLRSSDFFDVEKYKTITFTGTRIEKKSSKNQFSLIGSLTIKGISKEIKLDVECSDTVTDPWGNEKIGYALSGTISRKEWGLNWNTSLEKNGLLLSDEVKIKCEVELTKQPT